MSHFPNWLRPPSLLPDPWTSSPVRGPDSLTSCVTLIKSVPAFPHLQKESVGPKDPSGPFQLEHSTMLTVAERGHVTGQGVRAA